MAKTPGILAMVFLFGLGHQVIAAEASKGGSVLCGSAPERVTLSTHLIAPRAAAACMIAQADFTPREKNDSLAPACSVQMAPVETLASLDQ